MKNLKKNHPKKTEKKNPPKKTEKKNPPKKTEKKSVNKPEVPERSCVACGKTADRPDLLRFVTDGEGKAIYDRKGKLPGRGVYLCFDEECLRLAAKKNLFAKGFKENINRKEYAQLLEEIKTVTADYFFALLKSGRGAGLVFTGSSKCEKLLETSQAKLLLIPEDASEDTVKKAFALAEAQGVTVMKCPDKLTMAEELDVPLIAALAVTDEKLAEAVSVPLKRAGVIKSWLDGV
ncbi:DUF448 domain-containing protein [Geovibrio thiophilus]|uniref:DUF448 domain-containing protein n=1 Tax=Geovibrio thiophilus TaxID=139438 RepID=A0A3R5V155_9BACT|nr:YlxR family protein [Geovibrio thiophilus]QAR33081.1 DUF448 domain-containing protein [Geovibrio thiophilus]